MAEPAAARAPIDPPSLPVSPGPTSSESAPRDTLRARLRDETRAAHERLDACFAGLASGERAAYGPFLRMNEACHRTIAPLLAASPLAASHAPTADLRAAARADLDAMRLRSLAPAPFPIAEPSLAQSVGIAYVVAGSSLGARQILRKLRAGPETDWPPATFLEEAARGAGGFRAFLDLAETLVTTDPERDAAVRAADATFGYFLDVVRRAGADDRGGGGAN